MPDRFEIAFEMKGRNDRCCALTKFRNMNGYGKIKVNNDLQPRPSTV